MKCSCSRSRPPCLFSLFYNIKTFCWHCDYTNKTISASNDIDQGFSNLHAKVQIWIFIYVKGPDNWLLQNLFLINIHKQIETLFKIKRPLHSKWFINKCKSGKTINLSVCNRGRPIRVFSDRCRYLEIRAADIWCWIVWLICWFKSYLFFYLIKESKVIVYCRTQVGNSSSCNSNN